MFTCIPAYIFQNFCLLTSAIIIFSEVLEVCHLRRGFERNGSLDITKSTQDTDITTIIIKQNSDNFVSLLCKSFNNMIDSFTFSAALKLAHIRSVFKKVSKNSKEYYRSISILPNISKIYKRCLYKQMSDYFETFSLSFSMSFAQKNGKSVQVRVKRVGSPKRSLKNI